MGKASQMSSTSSVIVPPDYDPEKDKGEFMNPIMLEYFRLALIQWREELLKESQDTIAKTLQGTELQKTRYDRPRVGRNRPRPGASHP